MAAVGISGVRKSFGGTDVIRGIDIDIDDGSFVVLVGPSAMSLSLLKFVGQASLVDDAMLPS